jgi:solute carrier family 35, member E1
LLSPSLSHILVSFYFRSEAKSSTTLALSTAGGAAVKAEEPKGGLGETLQVGMYFALWYLFNIAYNIYNKQSLNALAFPWSIATLQMLAGVFYFVPLWLTGLRKAPKLSVDDIKTLIPIALCHTGVHVGAVIALGAGAVSFAHIVKASEPVVTCGLNALLLGQILPTKVYLTLLPIIGGVAIASMKELSFTVLALASAMLSNVSSAARGVLSKKTMSGKKIGENLDAQNLYAVLTAMSTVILIPAALAIEGTGMFKAFGEVVKSGQYTTKSLSTLLALGGASYYAYNEVAFLALGKVCRSLECFCVTCHLLSWLLNCLSQPVPTGQPSHPCCWKHYQACCHYCCFRHCIQDPYEHWKYRGVVDCDLWNSPLLSCYEFFQEINKNSYL